MPEVLVVVVVVVKVVVLEVLLVIVTLIVVVVRAVVCVEAVIGTCVEVLDKIVGVLLIVSGVAVDLLMDVLTGIIHGGGLTNIDVDVLWDVNGNVFIIVMTAFEFVMAHPLEEFRC